MLKRIFWLLVGVVFALSFYNEILFWKNKAINYLHRQYEQVKHTQATSSIRR